MNSVGTKCIIVLLIVFVVYRLATKGIRERKKIEHNPIADGQVVAESSSVTAYTEFEGQAYIMKKEEGGRQTPFSDGYKPQFSFSTGEATGEIVLESKNKIVMPGDNISFRVKLNASIAVNENDNFTIHENGRTVGSGVVTKIIK